jgi:hypothetical protein
MRIHRLLLLASISAPAIAASAPAGAQQPVVAVPPPPVVTVGPPVIRGRIQVCDCARGEHRVRLETGRRYAIGATSESFDPLIRLVRAGSETVIAEDDDSGGGVNARLTFTPPASGDYLVRVSSAAPGGVGDYALSVEPTAPMPALLRRPARVEQRQSQVFEGSLAAGSIENGRRYQDYELRLATGQSAMIHVQGQQELDTLLQVFTAAERGNNPLLENDDGGGGNDPFLFFAPTAPGDYVVRVIGFDAESTGPYRLRISR